jgi:hypothetical protein
MDFLTELKEYTVITTSEAIDILYRMIAHYSAVLSNILKIKQQTTDDPESFRKKNSNTDLLQTLMDNLLQLERSLLQLQAKWTQTPIPPEQRNIELLEVLKSTIAACEQAYEGKARSFAMILQDLERAYNVFYEKLLLTPQDVNGTLQAGSSKSAALPSHQKQVFVRLFHREMAKLGAPGASVAWAKPLLDSIKYAEKLGLAIYADEDVVKKSLKNECYGYVTLRIDQQQDISVDYPNKIDQTLNAPLLTVNDIRAEQLMSLTHRGVEYPIVEGRIRPPKQL